MNFLGLTRRAFCPLFLLLWPLFNAPLQSRAQAQPAALGYLQSYRAPAACPEAAQLERRIQRRLGAASSVGKLRFDVELSVAGASVRARLRVSGQENAPARELLAASCDEALDALALVAALMLQAPAQAGQRPASDAPREPSNGQARVAVRGQTADARARSSAASAQASSAAASAREPSEAASSTEQTAPAAVAAPEAAPDPVLPAPEPESEPAPARRPSFSAPRLSLFAAGFAGFHVLPQVRPGLGLGLALSGLVRRGPRLGLELAARALLPDLKRTAQGTARFSWLAGVTALCAEGPERRLSVSGCAVLELGALTGYGDSAGPDRTQARFWGALGPRLSASLALHNRVGLRLAGELLGVLVRDRFFLADRVVFSVPRLSYRGELALWVTIL